MPVEVIPTGAALGAEIVGVDLSREPSPAEAASIEAAWRQHLVVLFRGQRLTDPQLVRFSRIFGDLDLGPAGEWAERGGSSAEEFPEVWVISNVVENGRPIGSLGAGEAEWHTDMSYVETPPKASVLYAIEVPPHGGNTYFANMYRALDELRPELRQRIEGRRANHSSAYTSAGELRAGQQAVTDVRAAPGARHPILRRHEETGRLALYLGRRTDAYIDGLPLDESESMLDELWAECTRPELVYMHEWRVGDVLMWDNRCVIHRRDAFAAASRRIMHRTQIRNRATAPADTICRPEAGA